MNLTAIKDRAHAELLHVGDALTLLPFLPKAAAKIADIGSGGGTPAIPLAIVRNNLTITCIEATGKKAAFLQRTAAQMKLANVRVIATRAEDVGRAELRETFDVAIARAVGTMVWVAEYCLPLVRVRGRILAMKGQKVHDELVSAKKAILLLGGGEPTVHLADLPGFEGHVIVEICKNRPTPEQFPRLPSRAKGRPLGIGIK
jgi:16S rRNA (guanine527-N7)-methyltransferase